VNLGPTILLKKRRDPMKKELKVELDNVVGFPKSTCKTRFKNEFPIFDKVHVNGPNTVPVYKFLKSSKST
jgi:glutathione peroxidase-family protein